MDAYDLKNDPYLTVLRPLVEAYQAIFEVGDRHIRSMDLTPAQFGVIAELGGTHGMTAVELSRSTLLAKASLTGIIDRLEDKGLVERKTVQGDRRCMKVKLTKVGAQVHRKCFPAQLKFMRPFFEEALSKQEVVVLKEMLLRLRDSCQNTRATSSARSRRNQR
ncbi:MAG: MarR family winged helix-turn-helix transcriptional regulator [Nitrospirales bacterium]